MTGKFMQIRPTTRSQVIKLVERAPGNVHVTGDDNGTLQCLCNLKNPVNQVTIERELVAPYRCIDKKVDSQNVNGNLMDLHNRIQDPLGTPGLFRNKGRPRREDWEKARQTNPLTEAAKRTQGTSNVKFVRNRIRTRQVKTETPEFRVKSRESTLSVGGFTKRNNLVLPGTDQITLTEKLGRVGCCEFELNLWCCFG